MSDDAILGAAIATAVIVFFYNIGAIGKWLQKLMFGSIVRTLITAAIATMLWVNYFPAHVPTVLPDIWKVIVLLIGIWVMFYGMKKAIFGAKKK